MADSKKYNGSTWEHSLRKLSTATDTLTTLPADIYADGNNATVGISGNTVQNGTPSPDNPIMPEGTGERTGNLFDKSMADLYNHSTLGQANTWAYSTESTGTTLRLPCDANTQYTLSIGSTIGNTIFRISEISTDDVPIEGGYGGIVCHTILNGGAINNYTFTTASDSKYILFQVNANVMTAALNTLMLNTGSTPLPYEPNGYKIPISSANTTTPVYLGEVQTTRKIKKLVLTGSEDWRKSSVFIGSCFAYLSDVAPDAKPFSTIVCTHAENQSGTYYYGYGRIDENSLSLWLFDSKITVADFKAYLAQQYAAGTPVTVWYVLATETTGIVNEPLMKIGDYADEVTGITIPTIAGANTLSIGTTLQPSEVSVNYHGWHPVADVHERDNGQWD